MAVFPSRTIAFRTQRKPWDHGQTNHKDRYNKNPTPWSTGIYFVSPAFIMLWKHWLHFESLYSWPLDEKDQKELLTWKLDAGTADTSKHNLVGSPVRAQCLLKQREQTDLVLGTCRHELRTCSAESCHWSELCKVKGWYKTSGSSLEFFPLTIRDIRPELHAIKYIGSGPKLDPKYFSTGRNNCYPNNIQLSVAEWCVFLLWVLQTFI